MPSDDLVRDMGLDPDLITADFNASMGMASYYRRMRDIIPNATALAASLFRRAAAHTLLLDSLNESRVGVFTEGARAYGVEGHPYAHVMAAFAHANIGDLRRGSWAGRPQPQHAFQLLASLDNPGWSGDDPRTGLDTMQRAPVGVLGVPVGDYLRLYEGINALAGDDRNNPYAAFSRRWQRPPDDSSRRATDQVINGLQNILIRYDDALEDSRRDEYHWEMLESPLHPAEPEVFAALAYTRRALQRTRQESIVETAIAEVDVRPLTRALLRGINDTFNPPLMA